MLRWSKLCRLLFIFVFFCFVFDELSTINYPSKRHNLNPISKLKKEQKKNFLLNVVFIFKYNRPVCHKINITWQHYKIFVYM